jgi:hypothetical protein
LIDWALNFLSAAAHLRSKLWSRWHLQTFDAGNKADIDDLLRNAGEPDTSDWRSLRALPTRGDLLVDYYGRPPDNLKSDDLPAQPTGARVIVKRAVTPSGIAALDRHCTNVGILQGDSRLQGLDFQFPEILAMRRTPAALYVVERLIVGEDGRATMRRPGTRAAAMVAATGAISRFHRKTAAPMVLDLAWTSKWIDEPAAVLELPVCTLLSKPQKLRALTAFRKEQRAFWNGRTVDIGICHGDFCPGNLIFSVKDGGRVAPISVEGIIDWDTVDTGAPGGLDICHLLITTRRTRTGHEFGRIVRELLLKPRWDYEEKTCLTELDMAAHDQSGWPFDPVAVRAIVGLVWLHQIAANLRRSTSYFSNRLWVSANVERVLQTFL